MKHLVEYTVAFMKGLALSVVITVAILICIGVAMGHEGTPVWDAPLGMQDRSLNYHPPKTIEVVYVTEELVEPSLAIAGCNDKLNYMRVELIAQAIAKRPHMGYIYQDTLTLLHTLWCAND